MAFPVIVEVQKGQIILCGIVSKSDIMGGVACEIESLSRSFEPTYNKSKLSGHPSLDEEAE